MSWTNHVTVLASAAGTHAVDPSNPTAVGTVKDGSAFTPTAGRLLVCFVAGPVTSTTPSGWTLPSGGSAVGSDGLYVFYKTAAGGDTLPTTTHNSGAFMVTFDFYEFSSAMSFGSSAAFTGQGSGSSPSITGLTGTNFVLTAVAGVGNAGAFSFSGATLEVDYNATDAGHHYAAGWTSSSSSSVSVAATLESHEQVMFAVADSTITGSMSAVLPKVTASFAGTYAPPPIGGTFAATLPRVTAAFAGRYIVVSDTANDLNGLSIGATGTVTQTRPVAALPNTLTLAAKVDKAIAYPAPTMVDGRPT